MNEPPVFLKWTCPFCGEQQSERQTVLLAGIPGLPEWMQERAAFRVLKVSHLTNKHIEEQPARVMIMQIQDEASVDLKRALDNLMKLQ